MAKTSNDYYVLLKECFEDFRNRTPGINKESKNKLKRINDPNIYELVVDRAYNDAKRALHGIGKHHRQLETAKSNLAMALNKYFNGTESFDHQKLCDQFLTPFGSLFYGETSFKIITYGVAQKIVNLSFKYLYCFDEFRNSYREKFKPCHMVLDSFVLGWYREQVNTKTSEITWSKINEYAKYEDIQKNNCLCQHKHS
jgi:hypothetical protein